MPFFKREHMQIFKNTMQQNFELIVNDETKSSYEKVARLKHIMITQLHPQISKYL